MFFLRFARLVFLAVGSLCSLHSYAFAANCDPEFEKKLCVAEHANSRVCSSFPEAYKLYRIQEKLDELFQSSPEMVQLGFCNVSEWRVVKKWSEPQWRAFVRNNIIHFDRSVLFELVLSEPDFGWENGTYHTALHHKDIARRFSDAHELAKQLHHNQKSSSRLIYELSYVTIHELAHIIDFEIAFNRSATSGYFGCFIAHQIANHQHYEKLHRKIKGYSLVYLNQFDEVEDSSLFADLFVSPYASFYGLTNGFEDFAELFADYVLLEHFGINYTIEKNGEILFDRAKQFENGNIQNKLEIVKKVLDWPNMSEEERQAFADDRTHCRGIFEPSVG